MIPDTFVYDVIMIFEAFIKFILVVYIIKGIRTYMRRY